MAKGFTSGSGQTSTGKVGRKKSTRKDKTNQSLRANLNTVAQNTGPGMLNEVGLQNPQPNGQQSTWTLPEVQALNNLPNGMAAQAYAATNPYNIPSDPGNFQTSTATSTGSGGATQKQNFGNEYWWASPEAAVGNAMQGMGMSTDINSSFFNAMQSLAPGLKWMSLLGSGSPTGGIESFKGNVGNWMDSGQLGGLGTLSSGIGALLNGGQGNAFLEGYIDAMDPRQMLAAIGQMAQTAGYGQIAPELLQGMQGLMSQSYSDFANNGADLLANVGQGVSDMDIFRDFFASTGNTIADYFGNLGW